jgi:hypothetical protein
MSSVIRLLPASSKKGRRKQRRRGALVIALFTGTLVIYFDHETILAVIAWMSGLIRAWLA